MKSSPTLVIAAVLAISTACGPHDEIRRLVDPGAANQPASSDPTDYLLVEPEVFDLGIPEDFFQRDGRALARFPEISECHTQGFALAGDDIVISCILFNPAAGDVQTTTGKSFMLRARFCDVVGCDGAPPASSPSWAIHDITEPVPGDHNPRITRQRLKEQTLTEAESAIVHVMNHPSGITHDAALGGVWVANSVYDDETYTNIMLLDPKRFGVAADRAGAVLREQAIAKGVSAVTVLDDRYLFSSNWAGKSLGVFARDGSIEPAIIPNPFLGTKDHIFIEDCARWVPPYVICGGEYKFKAHLDTPDISLAAGAPTTPETLRVRQGRLQILRVDTSSLPGFRVELVGFMQARFTADAPVTTLLGTRSYQVDSAGREIPRSVNQYGAHRTPRSLPMEGIAIDPERRYMYFLPDDLPHARLIRMRLAHRTD